MSQATTQTGVKLVTLLVHKYKTCDVYVWKWKFTQKWKTVIIYSPSCRSKHVYLSIYLSIYLSAFIWFAIQ